MKIKIISFFSFLLMVISGAAQEKDPTVGLVLSGGGAKGLAHIGALKVIEEAGVQLDYIGGSSMGAIIGALYAAGYSAHQLDSIFKETNFSILLQDELPRSAKTFYEKEEAEKYVLTLPFDNFNISFPSGLTSGQNLYNLMSRLMIHVKEKRNFEDLPIPFFAIATDVETGEEVVLDSGYLPQVVSASAAIPTLFSPVEIDGRLLIDGGVSNNYPVEELKERGADIVIGVDVQDSLVKRDELKSVFDILSQVNNFRTIQDMRGKIEKTDVYINPPIEPFSVVSFSRGKKIIEAGEKAARKKMAALNRVSALQRKEERKELHIKRVDSLYIVNVKILGEHTYPRAYVMGKLKLKYPATISYKQFIFGINNLSATNDFKKVNYELIPLNDGYILELRLEENPTKTFLKMALHYDNLYKSGALINLTHKSFLSANDISSLDVVLGDNFRYDFQYYWDKGYYWSIGLRSRYTSFNKNVGVGFAKDKIDISEINVNQIEIEYADLTNQFYVQTLFEQVFSLGMGIEHKYLKVDSETIGDMENSNSVPSTVFDKSHYYSAFGFLKLDTYDNKYLPTKGVYFRGGFHLYLLSSDFNENFSEFSIAKGKLGYAFSPLPKFTARITNGAGFRIGNNENNSLNFFLGGFGNNFINNIQPFYGYDFLDLSGDSYIKSMLEVDFELFSKNHLIASANFANVQNDLFSTGDWFSGPDYTGYALGYALETFLGPLQAKYSYSPEIERGQWYFSLGFWF